MKLTVIGTRFYAEMRIGRCFSLSCRLLIREEVANKPKLLIKPLRQAIYWGNLWEIAQCDAKFLGLGLDYRTVGTGNSTIKFIDPNGDSALLNMTLGQLGVTTPSLRNDKLSDWVIGNNAYGFTIWETGTIYLGDSFKLQSPQEQGITIAHELLHAHVQGSEAKILNRLGVIDPRTGEVWDETDNRGADAGLNSYLKSGYQKATL